jgi:preprotein translocase subunit SecF
MNWMKFIPLYFFLSALVIIPGLFSLAKYGLKLSIEFTGGTYLTLNQIKQSPQDLTAAFKDYSATIQKSDNTSVSLKMKAVSEEETYKIVETLKKNNPEIKTSNFETIGPALGAETIKKTVSGLLIVSAVLVLYISFAFKQLKFGISAVVAALHDTAVVLGAFSLLGHFANIEVDLLFVTAVLTMLSYSVHDTIVVYDRIRELSHKVKNIPFIDLVNQAVTETMVRSLNNSLAVIFMLLAMFLIGGETTKYFALALLIGTITGTYSSTFVAAPILVLWDRVNSRRS